MATCFSVWRVRFGVMFHGFLSTSEVFSQPFRSQVKGSKVTLLGTQRIEETTVFFFRRDSE